MPICSVVLATGFIHILPEAMETLSDPCLPDSWNDYSAYAGLFAMLAALAMQLIEFLAHQKFRSSHSKHSHAVTSPHVHDCRPNHEADPKAEVIAGDAHDATPHSHAACEHREHQLAPPHTDVIQMETPMAALEACAPSAHHHHHGIAFQDDGSHNKISTYLLELGIALHSILIGLTLGTTTESFVALFIALCFHQFFEAIALGAQIAGLKTTSIKSAIAMVIFFSLTTPVGIAIGIGIHSGTYNPKSVSSLLVTGILDSLSAGILIYVALVNLITAEMGVNAHSFYSLSTPLKFLYFGALYAGVAAMAVIGRWA